MISYYTAIVLISSLAVLIMIFCAERSQLLSQYRTRCFQLLFLLLAVTNLSEWLAASLIGAAAKWHRLHFAAKLIELLLTPVAPFLAISAITGEHVSFRYALPVLANFALQAVSAFTGCVFSIDSSNIYAHGALYPVYVFLFTLEAVLLLVCSLQFSRRYQHANLTFLLLINLMTLLAIGMQFLPTKLRLDWVCISYAAIFFFIHCEQLIQQVDALTGLLNRRSFNHYIGRAHAAVTVIFLDVDRFKEVNDVYGHAFGDECLSQLAHALRAVFVRYGYCYRYGGDEFCVILRKNSAQVDALLSAYFSRIAALREADPRIPFVSAGYARYDGHQATIDDTLRAADEMMYRFKECHRDARTPQAKT